jgi:hypothetical protein
MHEFKEHGLQDKSWAEFSTVDAGVQGTQLTGQNLGIVFNCISGRGGGGAQLETWAEFSNLDSGVQGSWPTAQNLG